MSIETGFMLKKAKVSDKEIKTKEQYNDTYINLLYLGKHVSNELHNVITDLGVTKENLCYCDLDGKIKIEENKNEEYVINPDSLALLLDKIKPIYKLLMKYSDRILDNLYYEYDDKEIKLKDRKEIMDLLYEIDYSLGADDLSHLIKIYEVFKAYFQAEFNDELFEDGPKFEIIYWQH